MYEGLLESKAIEQQMMFTEYAYLYEHGTVIEESGDSVWESIKNTMRKVKDWIVKQWKKVCEFFKKVFGFFARKTMTVKKFVEKYESKVSSTEVKFKKSIEVHKNTIDSAITLTKNALKKLESYGTAEGNALSGNDYMNGDKGRYGDTYENDAQIKKLFAMIGDKYADKTSISSFKEDFKKECLGDKESKNGIKGTEMIAELKASINASSDLKILYTNTKVVFDNLKKQAERCEKAFKQNAKTAGKADDSAEKERYEKLSKAAGVAVKVFKLAVSVTEAVNHTGVGAIKILVDEKEKLALASIYNKEEDKTSTSESVSSFFGIY